jgi:flagellar biosynthesis protein FliP
MSYFDAVAIVIIFIVFAIAHYYLAVHPLHFLLKFFQEFAEFARGAFGTTGAVNILGVMVVALIGAFIFIETVLGSLLALALKVLDPQHAQEYVASVTGLTLLIVLAMLAAFSVLLTLFAEMSR